MQFERNIRLSFFNTYQWYFQTHINKVDTVSEEVFKQLRGEDNTVQKCAPEPPPKVFPIPNTLPEISSVWARKARERAAANAASSVQILIFVLSFLLGSVGILFMKSFCLLEHKHCPVLPVQFDSISA